MGKIAPGGSGIDFRSVLDHVDLRRLIVGEIGEPGRGGKWKCPFHDDTTPSMSLSADGKRFKCWSCGVKGDALEWVGRREGLTVVDAARRLDPSSPSSPRSSRPPQTARPLVKLAQVYGWQDETWQAEAEKMVTRAEKLLWSKDGRPALEWLRGRGLADHIITMFRLGFVPQWEQTGVVDILTDKDGPRGIKFPRGITFPWVGPNSAYSGDVEPAPRWVGINVRKLMRNVADEWSGPDKCMAVAGSERGYSYPHCDLTLGVSCLIVEGEIDALLAFQEVGHIVNVMTVGSATTPPRPEALSEMTGCPHWLIATDHDDAGDEASAEWRSRDPKRSRRMLLPFGKDIGEFHQSGGDLRAWLYSEFERLGLEPE